MKKENKSKTEKKKIQQQSMNKTIKTGGEGKPTNNNYCLMYSN